MYNYNFLQFIKILGPICGFLIGSVVNKLYFTFPTNAPPGLTTQDPQWIGAWWLGYLFIGILLIIPSLCLYFFPQSSNKNKSNSQKEILAENGKDALSEKKQRMKLTFYDKHALEAHDKTESKRDQFRKFVKSYKSVLSTKIYVFSVLGRVLDVS